MTLLPHRPGVQPERVARTVLFGGVASYRGWLRSHGFFNKFRKLRAGISTKNGALRALAWCGTQPTPDRYHLFAASWFHEFTPRLTNEARLGYNCYSNITSAGSLAFPGLDSFPNLTFDDLGFIQVASDPNAPQSAIQNLYQFVDNIPWVKGNHTLKFGFDGRKSISPQSFTQRVRGDYEYAALNDYLTDVSPTTFGERGTFLLRRPDGVLWLCQRHLAHYAARLFELRHALRIYLGADRRAGAAAEHRGQRSGPDHLACSAAAIWQFCSALRLRMGAGQR